MPFIVGSSLGRGRNPVGKTFIPESDLFALLLAEHIGLARWAQPVYYKQFAHTPGRIQSELRLIKADVQPSAGWHCGGEQRTKARAGGCRVIAMPSFLSWAWITTCNFHYGF